MQLVEMDSQRQCIGEQEPLPREAVPPFLVLQQLLVHHCLTITTMEFPWVELVAAVAGLALRGTMAGGLAQALAEPRHRDAAALTFLVTLSGVSVAGIGAAFWGVVAGVVTLAVQNWRK